MKKLEEIAKIVKKPGESVEVIVEGDDIDLEELEKVIGSQEWIDEVSKNFPSGSFTFQNRESE